MVVKYNATCTMRILQRIDLVSKDEVPTRTFLGLVRFTRRELEASQCYSVLKGTEILTAAIWCYIEFAYAWQTAAVVNPAVGRALIEWRVRKQVDAMRCDGNDPDDGQPPAGPSNNAGCSSQDASSDSGYSQLEAFAAHAPRGFLLAKVLQHDRYLGHPQQLAAMLNVDVGELYELWELFCEFVQSSGQAA